MLRWTLEPRCGVGPNAWHDGLHRHRAFGGSLVLQDTRARQRRNWEDRPASAETQTTVWVTRTVTLSVTTFLDVNANGNWDADETAPTTPVIVGDGAGDTVAFTTTSSWQITRTVTEGQHSVSACA